MNQPQQFDLAIIGTGPAGLTAGIYTSRAKLNTVLLEKESFGGYLSNIELVDNFSGLANISGQELSAKMLAHLKQYNPQLVMAEVLALHFQNNRWVIETRNDVFDVSAIIIASGSFPRKLNIPGEDDLLGRGVFYCATCDGYQFKDKTVAVAGGGDSALTEALNLSKIASEVVIIEITDDLTGTCLLRDKVVNHPKIEVVCGVRIEKINGVEKVESLELIDIETQSRGNLDVDGLLVHIGRVPNTGFLKGVVPLSSDGFIIVDEKMESQVHSLYAAGDVRQYSPMQIIAACGDGAIAAVSAIKKLGQV